MGFLNPAIFIAGIAALSLPILVHLLLRRRRRSVPWAAMRFLEEALRRQRSRLKLEQILLLLLRCAVVLLIGTALARPLFGAGPLGGRSKDVLIVFDDTLASATIGAGGEPEIDRTRRLAEQAAATLDPARGDRATIVSLSSPARALTAVPLTDAGAIARVLREVRPTAAGPDWSGAARVARGWLANVSAQHQPVVVVAGALREGSVPLERPLEPIAEPGGPSPTPIVALARPVGEPVASVGVTQVTPLRSVAVASDLRGPAGQVRVNLARRGAAAVLDGAVSRVRLFEDRPDTPPTDDAPPVAEATVAWEPGEAEQSVTLTPVRGGETEPGRLVYRAEVETAGDRLPADNAARSIAEVRRAIRVGVIAVERPGGVEGYEPADWVSWALRPSSVLASAIELVPLDPQQATEARLSGLDAAIVLEPGELRADAWDGLAGIIERGGLVLLTASAEPGAQPWGEVASSALGLGIEIDADPVDHDPPLAIERAGDGDASVFELLAGELDGLLAGAAVDRSLTVRARSDSPLRPALMMDGGRPLLLVGRPGQNTDQNEGRAGSPASTGGTAAVLAVAADLAWTDLPARPAFLPIVQELLRQGVSAGASSRAVEAGRRLPTPGVAAELVSIRDGSALAAAEDGRTVEPVRVAGAWQARAADGSAVALVVANPATEAAGLDAVSPERLERWMAPWLAGGEPRWVVTDTEASDAERVGGVQAAAVAGALGGGAERTPFDWPLLVIAGVLALVESVVARIASHAGREGSVVGDARLAARGAVARVRKAAA